MRIFAIGALIGALAGCSSPSPQLLGVDPVRVQVEGWEIDVYAQDGYAEAIRLSVDWHASDALMRERGIVAVETATGWQVDRRSATGDGNIVKMTALTR